MRDGGDVLLAFDALVVGGIFAGAWLVHRREKERIRREKMTGRLPIRRSPPTAAPTPMNPVLKAVLVVVWAFLPVVMWFIAGKLMRLIAPPPAWKYLPPLPPFSSALRWTLAWCLFCAGVVAFCWAAIWLELWLRRHLADPVVSRATELMKAGNVEEAIRELQEAINANGPSVARWNALADALMKQERWIEALKISLDVQDGRWLDSGESRRIALALCKLGLPEVVLSQSHRPITTGARRIPEICSYCQALIDWGLFDRAWDQLRRAEVIYGGRTFPEAERPHWREQIDACRARLAEHFLDKKPDGLDEF